MIKLVRLSAPFETELEGKKIRYTVGTQPIQMIPLLADRATESGVGEVVGEVSAPEAPHPLQALSRRHRRKIAEQKATEETEEAEADDSDV